MADFYFPPISQYIWDTKYRYKDKEGVPVDKTIEDTWMRVAEAVASKEQDKTHWAQAFYNILHGFRFIPGGRILSNAGTSRANTTMFNCFVMGTIPDSLEGIFDTIKESALTQKQGGGVGYDFSTIRPSGSYIRGVESDASGPVSFMQVADATCRTIQSAGNRRGAQLGALRCDHPDIEAFIDAKRGTNALQMFNLSVAVTDAFMHAVMSDAPWQLVFNGKVHKIVSARELWNKIMRSTYDYAEPGVLFVDTINRVNNLRYCETIAASNPCVTGDMLVSTKEGLIAVADLVERPFVAVIDNEYWSSAEQGFFWTGLKPVLALFGKTGNVLRCTADHLVMAKTQGDLQYQWTYAGKLIPGDKLATDGTSDELVHIQEDGVCDVYDCSIPGVNAFVANGFVVHNCGEIPLPPYGSCLLGSINLTKFAPFTQAQMVQMGDTVTTAIRFLDNVIDISNYPLPQQKAEAQDKRRIGLGITGLADALIMSGVRYGSADAVRFVEDIMGCIARSAYEASSDLAAERACFPMFQDESTFELIKRFPEELKNKIGRHGLRNSHLLAIAPTGTISLLAGNVSSGIEPVFAWKYERKIRQPDGTTQTYEVRDYADAYSENEDADPDVMVTCDQITPDEHIAMQAAAQKWVDSAISKTINVPTDTPFEQFKAIYTKAWQAGIKGCTTFRPSDKIQGILIKKEEPKQEPAKTALPERPVSMPGVTYKIKTPLSPDAFYVTINDLDENGKKRPYEIFINTKNLQHFSWIVAMTRLISAVFRREADPSFLVDELKSIYDPAGGYFSNGEYVPSLPAELGRVIAAHLKELGTPVPAENVEVTVEKAPQGSRLNICPKCKQPGLVVGEGCEKCIHCDYSKCS